MTFIEAEQKIVKLADQDFLFKLAEIAKLYGWSCDYSEISDFVKAIHILANKEIPDMRPYEKIID